MIAIKKYLVQPLRYTMLTGLILLLYSLHAESFSLSRMLQSLLVPSLLYITFFAFGFLVLLFITWISCSTTEL